MTAFLRRLESWAYLLLRVGAGGMFLFHGLQRLFGMYGGHPVGYLSRLGIEGAVELIGGGLVALGAWTVPAALVASLEQAVVYYLAHGFRGAWPIQTGAEQTLLYAVVFLFIATRGPGRLAVDRLLGRK
jgi:putative oxidoreductase